METHAKSKSTQLYTTMREEPSIQEHSEAPEDLRNSASPVEDPQDDMDNDKSSDQLNDFVSTIKSGKVRECLFCDKKGHRFNGCLSAKASSAKGRASAAAPEPSALEKTTKE